jgi:hypothetical protein
MRKRICLETYLVANQTLDLFGYHVYMDNDAIKLFTYILKKLLKYYQDESLFLF